MHSRFLITFSPPRATLYLAGEFDVTDRAALHRRIEDAIVLGCVRLEVDGAAVTFIDSACLRELDAGKTRLAKLGRSLVVRRTSPVFERVANLCGYRGLLTESQTSDFSAPVTAPDCRATSAVPVRSAGHDPLAVGYRAPQEPGVPPQGRADGA
jgi:anti-anti-sigma factor